jgi:hypothetical protein
MKSTSIKISAYQTQQRHKEHSDDDQSDPTHTATQLTGTKSPQRFSEVIDADHRTVKHKIQSDEDDTDTKNTETNSRD